MQQGWSTVWEVQYLDPQFKLEMEGQAVPTNAPIALVHDHLTVLLYHFTRLYRFFLITLRAFTGALRNTPAPCI
jgi:hypothetical protein